MTYIQLSCKQQNCLHSGILKNRADISFRKSLCLTLVKVKWTACFPLTKVIPSVLLLCQKSCFVDLQIQDKFHS